MHHWFNLRARPSIYSRVSMFLLQLKKILFLINTISQGSGTEPILLTGVGASTHKRERHLWLNSPIKAYAVRVMHQAMRNSSPICGQICSCRAHCTVYINFWEKCVFLDQKSHTFAPRWLQKKRDLEMPVLYLFAIFYYLFHLNKNFMATSRCEMLCPSLILGSLECDTPPSTFKKLWANFPTKVLAVSIRTKRQKCFFGWCL